MSGSVWVPESGQVDASGNPYPPPYPSAVLSGVIPNPSDYAPADWTCGHIDITTVSGDWWVCGSISPPYVYQETLNRYCCKCGRCMGSYYTVGDGIQVTGVCGFIETWCWQCAGYSYQGGGFETREDWLREGSPFASGTPCWLMADWYEEQGRCKDAEWLRIHRSGK